MLHSVKLFSRQFLLKKMELKFSAKSVNGAANDAIIAKNVKLVACNHSEAINLASGLLYKGSVIALPTDTVYGLACSANDPLAIQKLYDIKGRDELKPVAICVSSIKQLKHWGEASHLSKALLEQLLPGAVTIVLNKSKNLDNPYLNPDNQKIGIRIPDCEFIRQVSFAFVAPIALTSANKSGEKSTLEVYEFKDLWSDLGAVFDGGHLGDVNNKNKQRSASTVIDLSEPGYYQIIRNGIAVDRTIDVMNEFGIKKRNLSEK